MRRQVLQTTIRGGKYPSKPLFLDANLKLFTTVLKRLTQRKPQEMTHAGENILAVMQSVQAVSKLIKQISNATHE